LLIDQVTHAQEEQTADGADDPENELAVETAKGLRGVYGLHI
jgi:hypothetical protein